VEGYKTEVDGKPRVLLQMNNNDYQDVDPLAVKIIYNISIGNNRQQFDMLLPNNNPDGFTNVNGEYFDFGDTVQISISKEYQDGTVKPIETHIITMPSDTSSTASGSI